MSHPVRVVTTRQTATWPKGAELEFASVADADKTLGEGAYKVRSNADGTPYVAPKAEKPRDEPKDG